MATLTTRFGFRKPAGTDAVNVQTDLNANLDIIDAKLGAPVVTSGTRPAGPVAGQLIRESDTGNFLVHNGTNWQHASIPVVTSTAQILAPYEGLVVLNTTDSMLYRRVGTAWTAFAALGGTTGPTSHEMYYYNTAVQSIPNVADTQLAFPANAYVSDDVTPNASFNAFTLNRTGLWVISAGVRIVTGTSGERHLFLGLTDMLGANRLAGASAASSIPTSLNVGTEARLNAGSVILAGAYQSSGAARNTDPVGFSVHMSMAWIRP